MNRRNDGIEHEAHQYESDSKIYKRLRRLRGVRRKEVRTLIRNKITSAKHCICKLIALLLNWFF